MPNLPAESLLGGVSRQPDPVRRGNQLEESINMIPDVSRGLVKRPSEDLLKFIPSGILENTFTHFFEDANGERYLMAVFDTVGGGSTPVRIWNIDRQDETDVNTPVGATATNAYFTLASGDPRDNFKADTSADTTILVNTTVIPSIGQTVTPTIENIEAAFFVKTEQANSAYTVRVRWASSANPSGNVSVTYTSPASSSSNRGTEDVAAGLEALLQATALGSDGGVVLTTHEGVIYVQVGHTTGNTALELIVEVDPLGNGRGITAINGEVKEFTDLPTVWKGGGSLTSVKVTGTEDTDYSTYYVHFSPTGTISASGAIQAGIWEEFYAVDNSVGVKTLTVETLPARLILDTSDFTAARGYAFLLEHETAEGDLYPYRVVGDSESSPDPSFINFTINDVFFFKNRLGYLSNENVILSEVGSPFNFYATTVLDVLDTDPIDVTADSGKVNILNQSSTSENTLTVFSKDTQFTLEGSPLTPSSATLTARSNYEASTSVKPSVAGKSLLFVSPDTDNSSRVFEYQQVNTGVYEADDVTIHIPEYIVGSIEGITSHAASRTTLCWTNETDTGIIYVNNTLWQNQEKVQNAWQKWKLNSTGQPIDHIMGCHFFNDTIVVLMRDTATNEAYVVELDKSSALWEPQLEYRYRLDFRQLDTDLTVTPNGGNFDFDYQWCSEDVHPKVVRHNATTGEITDIEVIAVSGTTVTIAEEDDFIVGMIPEYSWKPSRPILKDQNGNPLLHLINKTQFQGARFYHSKTNLYDVTLIGGTGRDDSTDTMDAAETEVSLYNQVALSTDVFDDQLGLTYRDLDLEITSNNIFPATFVSLEWQLEAGSDKG